MSPVTAADADRWACGNLIAHIDHLARVRRKKHQRNSELGRATQARDRARIDLRTAYAAHAREESHGSARTITRS